MRKRIICLVILLCIAFSLIPVIETDVQAYAGAYSVPELTGNQAVDVVAVAKSQLGYSEGSDGGTVYGAWWSKVTNWGDYTYASWCAMFACWCANQAGVGMGVAFGPDCASVRNFFSYLKLNGKTDTSFSTSPRPGDFIFFGYGSTPSHVAIVEKYDGSSNVVTFIGGNQGNKVKRCTVAWSRSGHFGDQNVVGYGRPNYKTGAVTDAKPEPPTITLTKPVVSVERSGYLKGDDVTVSWRPVANSTGYSVAVYRDGKLMTTKSLKDSCSYKIYSVAAGSYTVKVTASNGVSAETGTCSFKVSDVQPMVRLWLSQTEMGEETDEYKIGNRYYLCCEILDEVSGKPLNQVRDYDYSVRLSIHSPNGEEMRLGEFDGNHGSGCFFVDTEGDYVFKAETDGDITVSATLSKTSEDNPTRVHVSADAVVLHRGTSDASAVVRVWTTGYFAGDTTVTWKTDNANVSCVWDRQLDDGHHSLVITAKSAGTTVITLSSIASGSAEVLDAVTITVAVDAEQFAVFFDANGGIHAPEQQQKTKGVNLRLSSKIPQKEGFIFLGWASSADGVTAEYQPGANFLENQETTLYAVWSQSFLSGDANADGYVNMKDWNYLYEHSNQIATLKDDTLELADVNGDGAVNTEDWARLSEHVCETAPLW